jgi:iron(III) transport system ATP-binding protein
VTPAAALEFRGVTRRYRGNRLAAVDDLSFAVQPGAMVALVGESGAGKTTALRLAAGFEAPDSGVIRVGGEMVADGAGRFVPAERRGIGLVFQDHALFPHLSVERNVAFGLGNLSKAQQASRVKEVLERVGLLGLARRMPHTLSGGQQQRVALARALAPEPRVLLLDEPFSSLDPSLRDQVRDDTCAVLRRAGASALFVTHDAHDALGLADVIVVLSGGRLEQVASPTEIYARPASESVARAFGACNVFQAELGPTGFVSEFGVLPRGPRHKDLPDGPTRIGIRPHRLQIAPSSERPALRILSASYHGRHWEAVVGAGPASSTLRIQLAEAPVTNGEVRITCDAEDVMPL